MSITIKQIAELAGVSRGTVDRVLNNRGSVTKDKQDRILRIARDHGYVKNEIASKLALRSTIKVAVLLPELGTDEFWDDMRAGVSAAYANVMSYGVEIHWLPFALDDDVSYANAIRSAILYRPDALLIAPVHAKETNSALPILEQNGIKVFSVNTEMKHSAEVVYTGQNSYQSGRVAARLFHMAIADPNPLIVSVTIANGKLKANHVMDKINGLRDYLDEQNTPYELMEIDLEMTNLTTINQAFMSRFGGEIVPTGIFFTNSRAHLLAGDLGEEYDTTIRIGYDLVAANVSLLRSEKLHFLLNQNPFEQGRQSLISIFNDFIEKKIVKPTTYLPIDIVMKENCDAYLQRSISNK